MRFGPDFNQAAFEAIYHELDQSRYHPLTEDNQDNVAYLCVMVGGAVLRPDEPSRLLAEGHAFRDVLNIVGDRVLGSAPLLAPFHDEIVRLVLRGDPTPFKIFRQREYAETVALMGKQTSDLAEELLASEIVITGEIWELAKEWSRRGALLFGLSDKPDEAAYRPAHWVRLARSRCIAFAPILLAVRQNKRARRRLLPAL